MNTLLQKCVDALKEEKPDLSYIRGILETIISIGESTKAPDKYLSQGAVTPMPTDDRGFSIVPKDEKDMLEAPIKAMLAKIPPPIVE